ncbi:10532_t:CDS:2 [Acaulospora morrowiae]|uniref:10532_t:CDS:1 n=1 Tax=Acaulospora morrowiae TaxID=94023 RepID=A0A9N9BDH0_9GLOM|nr:10532_t:CDS:2 [Acaulospora morrowiae]
MTTERLINDYQISDDWLLNEQRKFEYFCNENLQEFTATCLLEVEWLKSYLTDVILHSSAIPRNQSPECTNQDQRHDAQHGILGNRKHSANPEAFPNNNILHSNGFMISDAHYDNEQDKGKYKDPDVNNTAREHESKKLERKKTLNNSNFIRTGQYTEPYSLASRDSNAASRDCIKTSNDNPNKKTFPKRLAQSKPEIKSLVLAAAAAKKEQEEQEKKSERIKEWEAKRLAALQRRQEEEQKRLQNAKQREEAWKRKANFVPEVKKKENEGSRKKRVEKFVVQKKKKDIDMQQKNDVSFEKTLPHSEFKEHLLFKKSPLRSSDFLFNKKNDLPESNWNTRTNDESLHMCQAEPSSLLFADTDTRMSGDEIGIILTDNDNEILKSARKTKTSHSHSHSQEEMNKYQYKEESFLGHFDMQVDLTETSGESSSSEEEVNNPKRPEWCQPSNLKAALIRQASIDPEIIFGKVQPLNMEKIFKGRERKFRQRSSSANWLGGDALTVQEEIEYKSRMGFK